MLEWMYSVVGRPCIGSLSCRLRTIIVGKIKWYSLKAPFYYPKEKSIKDHHVLEEMVEVTVVLQVVMPIISPFNSCLCPLRKPGEFWRMTLTAASSVRNQPRLQLCALRNLCYSILTSL